VGGGKFRLAFLASFLSARIPYDADVYETPVAQVRLLLQLG
jgi:hypothetical protein